MAIYLDILTPPSGLGRGGGPLNKHFDYWKGPGRSTFKVLCKIDSGSCTKMWNVSQIFQQQFCEEIIRKKTCKISNKIKKKQDQTGLDRSASWSGFQGVKGRLRCTGLYWAVLGCTGLYWAVLGCIGLYWAVLGGTGLTWAVPGLYWAVLGCTALNQDALGGTWLYWAVLGCAGLYLIVLGCTGIYYTVLGGTGMYLAVFGCTGLYWAVLGCTRL